MTNTVAFFRVLTEVVLGRTSTGYRGIYRATPLCLALSDYERHRDACEALLKLAPEKDRFDSFREALRWADLARDLGFACEIVWCGGDERGPAGEAGCPECTLLGWDVAVASGGFYSAVVDLCLPEWESPSHRCLSGHPIVQIAASANRQLNQYRLFRDRKTAQRFRRACQDCCLSVDLDINIPNVEVIAIKACLGHLGRT